MIIKSVSFKLGRLHILEVAQIPAVAHLLSLPLPQDLQPKDPILLRKSKEMLYLAQV
jgi:hypothetical protein